MCKRSVQLELSLALDWGSCLVMKRETRVLLACLFSCSVFPQLGLSWVTFQNE